METLIKLLKPLTWFINFILKKWYEFDEWWIKKSLVQKNRYRNGFIIFCLIGLIIYLLIKGEVDKKLLEKDYNNKVNNCTSELNQIKKAESKRMELEIESFKIERIERKKIEKERDSLSIVLSFKK